MRIDEALASWSQLETHSESPKLDVELLLCAVLEQPRSYLFTWPDRELNAAQQQAFLQMLQRRLNGEPIAHITGSTGFWTLILNVSPATLIPRPETELLVELALELLPPQPRRIVDLGTGTGAIALALASERLGWQVEAVEYNADAVVLANTNRQQLGLERVTIHQGSWFEPLNGRFDLILSNPPYIDPADPHLVEGDVRFEPDSALTADEQGMADIRYIATNAVNYLQPGGWLMFEHGYDQGPACTELLQTLGYQQVRTVQDYGARDRVTLGCWLGERNVK